jgi:hypothetical protein
LFQQLRIVPREGFYEAVQNYELTEANEQTINWTAPLEDSRISRLSKKPRPTMQHRKNKLSRMTLVKILLECSNEQGKNDKTMLSKSGPMEPIVSPLLVWSERTKRCPTAFRGGRTDDRIATVISVVLVSLADDQRRPLSRHRVGGGRDCRKSLACPTGSSSSVPDIHLGHAQDCDARIAADRATTPVAESATSCSRLVRKGS